MRNRVRFLFVILQIVLIINMNPVMADDNPGFDTKTHARNYSNFYSGFIDYFESYNNLIASYQVDNQIYDAVNQGFSLVNLMRFYELYENEQFINDALSISDNIGTYFIDLRYDLAASYYRSDLSLMIASSLVSGLMEGCSNTARFPS